MLKDGTSFIYKLFSDIKVKRLGLVIIMSVLLASSSVVNILLAREVSSLRVAIKSRTELIVGESVKPIIAQSLDGNPTTLKFSGSLPTILYVFSPQCVWCMRNFDNIKAIVDGVKGKYKIIGLSISSVSLEQYVADYKLSFPVYKEPDQRSVIDFKLRGTPQTIVISQDGMVLKNWQGAYSGDQKHDVENFFGVNLPGVRMDRELKK